MRRSAASALAALLLGLSVPISTRATPWSIEAGGGAAFPAGGAAFLEGLATGWIAIAAVGYAISPAMQILVRGSYSDYPRDDDGTLLVAAIDKYPFRILGMSGGAMRTWDLLGELRRSLSPGAAIVRPYVLGAAGLTSYSYERVDIAYAYAGHTWPAVIPGEESTVASLAAGGGVQFAVRPWLELAIETRLHVALRNEGALWSVPLWITVAVSP